MIIMPVSRMRKLSHSEVMDLPKAAWLGSNGAGISGQVLNPPGRPAALSATLCLLGFGLQVDSQAQTGFSCQNPSTWVGGSKTLWSSPLVV